MGRERESKREREEKGEREREREGETAIQVFVIWQWKFTAIFYNAVSRLDSAINIQAYIVKTCFSSFNCYIYSLNYDI